MKVKSKPRTKESSVKESKVISQGSIETRPVLGDSEIAELRVIFDAFPFYVLLLDTRHKILLANKAIAQITGKDPLRIIGEYCPKLIHKMVDNFPGCPLEESVRTGNATQREFLDSKNQTWMLSQIYPTKYQTEDGQDVYIHFVQDITRSKISETHLAAANERLQYLLSSTSAVVYAASLKSNQWARIVTKNVSQMVGYEERDFTEDQDFWVKHLHPDDRERVLEEMKSVFESTTRNCEYRFLHKNGHYVWIRDEMKLARDKQGAPLELVGFWLDITDRKCAEEDLAKKSEEQEILLDNIATQIWYLAEPSTFGAINKACADFLGGNKSDFEGRNYHELLGKKEANICIEGNKQVFETRKQVCTKEWVANSKDEERLLDIVKTPKLNENGDVEFAVCSATDITEQKKMEEKLRTSYERLKRAFEDTVRALASVTGMRDPYTAGHQERVAKLAYAIAKELGFDEEQLESVRVAATVHDLGKIYVPAEILNKPGKLNEIEMTMIKAHSQASYDILNTIELPWQVAEMVLQHHERMDGSGYPNSLSGEEILMEARILAVADVVEAMASHRPYRPALGINEALDEIKSNRGSLYDSKAVDACVKLCTEKGFEF